MRRAILALVVAALAVGLLVTLMDASSPSLAQTPQAAAQPGLTWRLVGQVGGPTLSVAAQRDPRTGRTYAYAGVGIRLIVLDVTDPVSLTEVGATAPFPHFAEGVAVSGTWAYVAAGGAGLHIVDVSDPTRPVEVGAWDSPGYAEGVAIAGTVAYLADGPYGLRAVDVSDPRNPIPLGSAYDMNYAFDVAVFGRHVYVAAAGAGLLLVDVTDPRQLREVATLDTPGYAQGVAVSGTLAYVADEWEGLQVVDVSNPVSPTLVGTCRTPGWSFGVTLSGTLAYVADAYAGLQVVDVSRPLSPTVLGGYPVDTGHAGAVALVGSMAYVADRNSGLRVVSVAVPSRPAQVGFYDMFVEARDVRVAGDYAYVAAGRNGLRVVDVSDPARSRQVGVLQRQGHVSYLDVEGSFVYLARIPLGSGGGLDVIDVSRPDLPKETGHFSAFNEGWGVDVDDGTVYVAGDGQLWLLNVSVPNSPTFVSRTSFLWGAQEVEVSGTLVYAADANEGLKIVDVSNVLRPRLIGTYNSGEGISHDVTVSGSVAYVADHFGLRCVDVSDPTNPRGIAFGSTPEGAGDVALSGTLMCLSVGDSGVWFFDASNPYSPTLAATVDTPGHALQVTMAGGRVYVADGSNGLLILERVAGYAPAPLEAPVMPGERQSGLLAPLQPVPHRVPTSAIPQALGTDSQREPAAWRIPAPSVVSPSGAAVITGTFTVTNAADSGSGTLRWCLDRAAGGSRIAFDPGTFPAARPVTIEVLSPLPALNQGSITIDASGVGVVLDGSRAPPGTSGLLIQSSANIVCGLQIVLFPGDGVHIRGQSTGNIIGGKRTVGSGPVGQGNRLSGNGGAGVAVVTSGAVSNTVSGNYIGTSLDGHELLGNRYGVLIGEAASHNHIGGTGAGEGNVIGGSLAQCGGEVFVVGSGTHSNHIEGNLIGTTPDGAAALRAAAPAAWIAGIVVADGASENVVGPGNVISAESYGVLMEGEATQGNRIVGNRIGTDASGTKAIGNFDHGVELAKGAHHNWVGGTGAGDRNVISGNGAIGISVSDGAADNIIVGNNIGTDATGTAAIGNGSNGISLGANSRYNRVGGASGAERNIISGNTGSGVVLSAGATGNVFVGNFVGTDASGTTALGNRGNGMWIGGSDNQVGGRKLAERNIVSANGAHGIQLIGSEARGNWVVGNYVGTDADGRKGLGNVIGLSTEMSANRNRIEGNLVGGNARYGILASDPGSSYNAVLGNRVGTDVSGTRAIPNGLGVYVGFGGASFNRIGGTNPGEGNIVSGNDAGVSVEGAGTAGNLVLGNWIGTDVSGARSLPNHWSGLGLGVGGRAFVGGAAAAERNVISGNGFSVPWPRAIDVRGSYHYLAGNYIGTDATGNLSLGNQGAGAWLRWADHSFIQGNVIAHSTDGGVVVESYASNTLRRNSIYGHSVGGIRLLGGNESLPAPVIAAVTETSVQGAACPGCRVEVFSDAEDEGRIYEGTTVADAAGRFSFTKAGGLTGPYVTTTATDDEGNTSEFSAPSLLIVVRVYLPLMLKGW